MEVTAHTTEHVAPALRAAHWNRVIADTYFPLHLTYRDPACFVGKLERRQVGDVSLSRLMTGPMQYERRPNHISVTREEEYLITVPRLNPIEFRQLGRDVRCDPGGFILERGDEPYRFSYASENDLSVLKISKRALAEKIGDPDRFCAKVFDGRDGIGALFTGMLMQMQSVCMTEDHAGGVLSRQIIELLGLALDAQADCGEGAQSSVRTAHLRRAEQFARRNLSNADLSPELIAEACGISKRYLHELFSDTNKTVSQYIREQRLIAARDSISSSRCVSMADIAYRYGFSDQAQFSRLFKSMFNQTPSDWRRAFLSSASQ